MIIRTPALLLAIALVNGCTKKPEPAASARIAPPPVAPAGVAPATPGPAVPATPSPTSEAAPPASRPEQAVTYEVDAGLQKILVKFYNDKQRPAMTWEDLLKGNYIPAIR